MRCWNDEFWVCFYRAYKGRAKIGDEWQSQSRVLTCDAEMQGAGSFVGPALCSAPSGGSETRDRARTTEILPKPTLRDQPRRTWISGAARGTYHTVSRTLDSVLSRNHESGILLFILSPANNKPRYRAPQGRMKPMARSLAHGLLLCMSMRTAVDVDFSRVSAKCS